jgi:membrane dipeptidase
MQIVDAHLDLSYNAVRGRPVQLPANLQKPDEEGIPTVGLPDLRQGGVNLVCATIFCAPSIEGSPGYRSEDEAHAAAIKQLNWYQQQESTGAIRFCRRADEISGLPGLGAILLLEGADPIRNEADLQEFWNAGLRIVGLAWKQTRFAGGTGAPGPLTLQGIQAVKAFDHFGIIHDTSHLAEASFWQLLQLTQGPVMASHSNCRAIVPTDRQLSDEMIHAIGERGGIIGINFFDKFLLPPEEYGKRRATLEDVVKHVRHICDLLGNCNQVGLGTDMDGGLGRNEIPVEIETSADLPKVADALIAGGFSDGDVSGMMGDNWRRYFSKNLPRK